MQPTLALDLRSFCLGLLKLQASPAAKSRGPSYLLATSLLHSAITVSKKDHTVSFAWQAEAVDRGVAHYVASENTSAKSHSTVPASSLYTPMRYLGCYVPGQALTSFLKSTCVFFFPGGVPSQELTFLLKSLDSWEDHPPVCPCASGHLNTDWVVHEAPTGSLSDEVETTHEHAGQTNYGIQGPRYQSSESISLTTHPAWCGTRDLCPGNLGHL